MTIDERLDRLTQRHEALILSAKMHDRQIGEILAAPAGLPAAQETTQIRLAQVVESINSLALITERRAQRQRHIA